MKIVILDGYSVTQSDLNWESIAALPDVQLTVYDRTAADQTFIRCSEADAVLTNKVVIDGQLIGKLPRLRYIGVLATGYNVVDINAAQTHGITVTNIPAYSTASVAQLVFAHLLNVTNCVAHYAEANRKGRWVKSQNFMWTDTPLTELQGKTFVIRGMGNIGMEVSRIALAFGMNVLAVTNRPQSELPQGVVRTSWDEALPKADVLSLHCPLTDATRSIINRESLSKMKPSAILINTGRGPLTDEAAVAHALTENRLAAYCADVLTVEPARADNPLLSAPRCYLTPHIAWATREARQRLIDIATQNIVAFLNGKARNTVSHT